MTIKTYGDLIRSLIKDYEKALTYSTDTVKVTTKAMGRGICLKAAVDYSVNINATEFCKEYTNGKMYLCDPYETSKDKKMAIYKRHLRLSELLPKWDNIIIDQKCFI